MLSTALLTLVLCTGQVLLESLLNQGSTQSPEIPFRRWNSATLNTSPPTAQPPQKLDSFKLTNGYTPSISSGQLQKQNSLGSVPNISKPWQKTSPLNSRVDITGSPSGTSTPTSVDPLPKPRFSGSLPQRQLSKPPLRSHSFGDGTTRAFPQLPASRFGANKALSPSPSSLSNTAALPQTETFNRSVLQNNDPTSSGASTSPTTGPSRFGSGNFGSPNFSKYSSPSGISTPTYAKPASSVIESLGIKIERSPLQEIKTPLKSLTEIYSKMANDDSKTITTTVDGRSTQIDIGERGSADRQKYIQAAKKYLETAKQDADSVLSPASKSPPVTRQLSRSSSFPASEADSEKVHPGQECTPVVVRGDKMHRILPNGQLGPATPLSPILQKQYDEEQAGLANSSSLDSGQEINACIMHNGKMVCPGHPDYEKVKAEHEHKLDSGYSSGDACIKYNNRYVCPGDPDYEKVKAAVAEEKSGGHEHDYNTDSEGDACIRYNGKTVCPGHPDYKKAKEQLEKKSADDALGQLRSLLSSSSIGQLGSAKPFGGIETEDLGVNDYGEYYY